MNTQNIEYYLDCCDPKAIRFDDLDEAVIGVDHKGQLCYLHSKMVDIFMSRDGMTDIEAMEYADFNVFDAYIGDKTPIFLDDFFINT